MNISQFYQPLVRQAIVILEGDPIVIPEIIRAIDCKIKPRYKACDAEYIFRQVSS